MKSLEKTDFETLFRAFSSAFSDYAEVQVNEEQLKAMLKRRGYNAELSFGMFEGEELLSFTLNGTGSFNGADTVYDTGTGTVIEHRRKKMASKVFEHSIPYLKKAGYKQYLLEVMQHNEKALPIYKNAGFEMTRELNFYVQKKEEIINDYDKENLQHNVREIDLSSLRDVSRFWDFHPSWQNSFESIERIGGVFTCLGAFAGDKLVGYCILFTVSGDIAQIAIDREFRRRGIGSLLLDKILGLNKNASIKIINTDASCESMNGFLKAKNINLTGSQFEMILDL